MNKSFSVFYSQAFSFPQTSSCQSLHFLIFRALIPPHLSFLLPLPIALLPSPLTPTAFSLWRLTSLANPCTDKRAKCVLLTINITWDALKIKAAPLLSPCTLRPPSSFLFISIQIAGRSTVCRDVPTLIGMRWGRINTQRKHTHIRTNYLMHSSKIAARESKVSWNTKGSRKQIAAFLITPGHISGFLCYCEDLSTHNNTD